ncbi:MAG: MaoC family dehydratase [Paracoccaceae bacterium]|jgi:2-methylfumaryl-CoA hydratase
MSKSNIGRFFEDYSLGEVIAHAVPRTLTEGERALYHALYPARHALNSSDEFARNCGLPRAPIDDWAAFHMVFGKTVPDISLNAVANLGYAEGRWLAPIFTGDTVQAVSEVIGLKENTNGKTGIVYLRTRGVNQHGDSVLEFVRWAMLRKRQISSPAPQAVLPELAGAIDAADLSVPEGLDFSNYAFDLAGEPYRLSAYKRGEVIDHVDAITIEEAEHMMATRLWQNTAKVHFDVTSRADGKRLIYGGHVISLARALSFNGLANAQMIVALNSGAHANPCFAGDTISAWSEVLDIAQTRVPGIGAMRLRLVAQKNQAGPGPLRGEDQRYLPHILLDLDYWALIPS